MTITRLWYYFRTGYITYVALVVGIFSNLVVIYKLGLDSYPALLQLFPHLTIFILVALAIGIPFAIVTGYYHSRRAFVADVEAGMLANPYNYLAIPGKERDVLIPAMIFNIKLAKIYLGEMGQLTSEIHAEADEILSNLEGLRRGERVP